MRQIAALLIAALPATAQLPDFYKSVDRIVWVVDDIDRTATGWRKLGVMGETRSNGDIDAEGGFRWDVARFGDVIVDFVQPHSTAGPYGAFKKAHGSGIMSFLHRVPTEAAMDAEIARLKGLGVNELVGGPIGSSGARYIIFDTEREGKYALGLIYAPAGDYADELSAPPPTGKKITQYAFTVKNFEGPSRYWQKLGWPAFTVTRGPLTDLRYRGKPADFESVLGWQRHGKVPYEWIPPAAVPTVYQEHLEKHGEGVHHLALNVDDIDSESAAWTRAGYPTSQSGGWGEKGKPGSGRFAYQDTHALGGIDVEFLWSYRAK